jgi:hypothetical protein
MKWLLVFVFVGLLFIGQASRVEASGQTFPEYFREVERIGQITDPDRQAQAISDFMKRMQGFGDPAKIEEAKALLNKYAFNMGDDKWAVIYESKNEANASSGGYIMSGEKPPKDAEILPARRVMK